MHLLNEALLHFLAASHRFWARAQREKGQTVAEYTMIMAVIAVGAVVLGVTLFRDAFISAFNAAIGCLDGTC